MNNVRALLAGLTVSAGGEVLKIYYRPPGQKGAGVRLGIKWRELEDANRAVEAYNQIKEIARLLAEGNTLKAAKAKSQNHALVNASDLSWDKALAKFKDHKLHFENSIDEAKTWKKDYAPVLDKAVAFLNSDEVPSRTHDLFEGVLREWKPGSRRRQKSAQNMAQFLRYCVERMDFPAIWFPPKDLGQFVGVANQNKAEAPKKIKGCAIDDQSILRIIDSLENKVSTHVNPRDQESALRWTNAVKLMALYGLRPIELQYLRVDKDEMTGNFVLWCDYEKRSGGGKTKPRKLEPLPLVRDGVAVKWNVFELMQINQLELPPLKESDGPAGAARKYLLRNPAWKSLRSELAAQKKNLVVYTFRHSYSLRGHKLGIDGGSMALAMGHSYRTHCEEYPWASEGNMTSAFEMARKSQALAAGTGVAT